MGYRLNRRGFTKLNALGGMAAGAAIASPTATARTKPAPMPAALNYGPAPGIAKLDSNENPFGPSPRAIVAMMDAARNGAYYVEDSVTRLKAMIAERHGVTPDHITLSSGSSGVLSSLSVAMTRKGHILAPDLFWDTTARAGVNQGGEIKRLPKTANLLTDLRVMLNSIAPETSLVHLTNPNNPTGRMLDADDLRDFCRKASPKTMVLVDEAYNEITDKPEFNSMVPLVKAGLNVVVARTFSKLYGLAGMRVGYMISSPQTAAVLRKYGLGDYTLNQAGLAAAIASYDDTRFLAMARSHIFETRDMLVEAATQNGLKPLPSQTNFVFVDLGELNAGAFRQEMAKHGVWIRGIYRDYDHHSRVSTGFPQDVARYVAVLPKVLDKMRSKTA